MISCPKFNRLEHGGDITATLKNLSKVNKAEYKEKLKDRLSSLFSLKDSDLKDYMYKYPMVLIKRLTPFKDADSYTEMLDEIFRLKEDTLPEVKVETNDLASKDDNGDTEGESSEGKIYTNITHLFQRNDVLESDFRKKFNINIYKYTVADLQNGVIVDDDKTLNLLITRLKNKLYSDLVSYLEEAVNYKAPRDLLGNLMLLFDSLGRVNDSSQSYLSQALMVANSIFQNKDIITQIDIARTSDNKTQLDKVNAFYSYVIIRNDLFDKLYQDLRGKAITIRTRLPFLTPAEEGKYSQYATKEVQKGLGVDRAAHSEKRASRRAVDIIESLHINTVYGTKLLELRSVVLLMNKITNIHAFLNENKAMYLLISRIHLAKAEDAAKLFEAIINSDSSISKLKLSPEEVSTIQTIYNNLYNPKRENSLYCIYARRMRLKPVDTFTLLDDITSMLFGQNSRSYLTTKQNGEVETYEKSYVKNKALEYSDQFNLAGYLMSVIDPVINVYEMDFAKYNQQNLALSQAIIYNNVEFIGNEGAVTNSIIITPEGLILSKDIPEGSSFKEVYFGMESASSVKYPLSIEQIIKYGKTGDINSVIEHGESEDVIRCKKNYIKYIEFVQSILPGMDFTGKDAGILASLLALNRSNFTTLLNKLVRDMSQVMLINHDWGMNYANNPENLLNFFLFLARKYRGILTGSMNIANYIDDNTGGMDINGHSNISSTMLAFAEAVEAYLGKASGTIKTALGNPMPLSLDHIASLHIHYLALKIFKDALESNIFGDNLSKVYKADVHIDDTNYLGDTKSLKEYEASEFNYTMFMNRFLYGIIQESNPYVRTLPVVYADKGMLDVHKVVVNGLSFQGQTFNLTTESLPVLLTLARTTVGSLYIKIAKQVLNDYHAVFRSSLPFYERRIASLVDGDVKNDLLRLLEIAKLNPKNLLETKKDAEQQIYNYQQDIDNNNLNKELAKVLLAKYENQLYYINLFEAYLNLFDDRIQEVEDRIKLSEIIGSSVSHFKLLIEQLKIMKANARGVDILNFLQCDQLLSITTEQEYENLSWKAGVDNVVNIHTHPGQQFTTLEGTMKGLTINWLVDYSGNELYADLKVFDKLLLGEKFKYVKDLLNSDTHFYTIHSNGKKNKVLKEALDKYNLTEDWVSNGEMIIAKTKDSGKPIYSIHKLAKDNFILNPLLDRYFLVDFICRTNLKHLTVGTELGHDNKTGKIIRNEDGSINKEATYISMHNSTHLASLKRAVGETLPSKQLNLSAVVAPPSVLRVALMKDILAPVVNVNGETKYIQPHDGSELMNPLLCMMINLALGGNATGEDIKGLLRGMHPKYVQAILFKYASFSLYNERMRNSQAGGIDMLKIFKKLTDIPWELRNIPEKIKNTYTLIDLTRGLYARYGGKDTPLFPQLVGLGKQHYFKEGRKVYRIHGLDKAPNSTDPNQYVLRLEEVVINEDGPEIHTYGRAPKTVERIVEINSIWKLFQALGGVYSGHFEGSNFVIDDSSLEMVVKYMNNIGIAYNEAGQQRELIDTNAYLTQDTIYLPLKHLFIASCLNGTGCKSGGNHLNPVTSWYDDEPLHYMEVETSGWGEVQDYDHDMSDSIAQMTEPTLVMTAMAAGGAMIKANEKVFKAITGHSIQETREITRAIDDYVEHNFTTEGKAKLYDILSRIIIRDSKKDGILQESIINDLKLVYEENQKTPTRDHSNDSLYVPFSDPALFAKSIVTIASIINKLGIKSKVSGYGGIMVPSYNLYTYFGFETNDMLGTYAKEEYKATFSDIIREIYKSKIDLNDGSYYIVDNTFNPNGKATQIVSKVFKNGEFITNALEVINPDNKGVTIKKYTRRNALLLNVISILADLDEGGIIKVENSSMLSLVLEGFCKSVNSVTEEQFLIELYDIESGVYTYTKNKAIPDSIAVKAYMSTLEDWNMSNELHEEEVIERRNHAATYKLPFSEGDYIKGVGFRYTTTKTNLKTNEDLSFGDSIILANEDGSVYRDDKGQPVRKTLDNLSDYISTKGINNLRYYKDIAKSKNLQPSKLRVKGVNGKWYDMFDFPQVREVFNERLANKKPSQEVLLRHRKLILNLFNIVDQGFVPVSEADFLSVSESDRQIINGQHYIRYTEKQLSAAECVIPKIFATLFGLRNGDSLHDILQSGAEFFRNRAKENYEKAGNYGDYDMCYVGNNGEHRYIRFTPGRYLREIIDPVYIDTISETVKLDDGTEKTIYKKIRVDEEGKQMYVLQIAELTDKDQPIEFKDYIVPLINSKGVEMFYVASPEAATELYSKHEYQTVKFNHNLAQLDNFKQSIKLFLENGIDLLPQLTITEEVEGKLVTRTLSLDEVLENINIDDILKLSKHHFETVIGKDTIEKFNSFKMSLDTLVARIPAQSLQSFMKMKVVGFTDSNKNSIMVSHYLLWLLGSDYDIDKAYSMMYEISKSGKFVTWSPYFSLKSESNIETSLELPLPSCNTVSLTDDKRGAKPIVDITLNILELLSLGGISGNFIDERLLALVKLLNAVGDEELVTYDKETISLTKDLENALINIINKHTTYFSNLTEKGKMDPSKPSPKMVGKAYRNCVTYNAMKISSSIANIPDSTLPITMGVAREAADESSIGNDSYEITQYSPSYIARMTNEFMVGKLGIGVAANGEKVFFSLLYYHSNILLKGDVSEIQSLIFNKTFKFGKSKFTRNIMANINLNYIQGVDPNTLMAKKELVRALIRQLASGQFLDELEFILNVESQLDITHDQALVISALLSAATDNAKELILSKINGDPKFMNMYIYCITLGIPFKAVSEFMTNPLIGKLLQLSRDNHFDEFGPLANEEYRLNAITKVFQTGIYDLLGNKFKRLFLEIYNIKSEKEYKQMAFNARVYIDISDEQIAKYSDSVVERAKFRRIIELHNTIVSAKRAMFDKFSKDYINSSEEPPKAEDIEKAFKKEVSDILVQFELIREGGLELTDLAALLSINQGIPVTLEDSLTMFNRVESMFKKPFKKMGSKAVETLVKAGVPAESINYAVNNRILSDFDFMRFLLDPVYRKHCTAVWGGAKHTFNIFDVITKIPHVWFLYEKWKESEIAKRAATTKYSIIMDSTRMISKNKFDKKESNKIAGLAHDALLYAWIVRQNIKFVIPKGSLFFKNKNLYRAKTDMPMTMDSHDGIANFRLWFESSVIPSLLKYGTMPGSTESDLKVSLNLFIRNLVPSSENNSYTGKRTFVYTIGIDFELVKYLNNQRDIFNVLARDLQKLESVSYLGNNLVDLFFMYNLVSGKNLYGPGRILPFFQQLLNRTPLVLKYNLDIGDNDWNNINDVGGLAEEDMLMSQAPVVRKDAAKYSTEPYIRVWSSNNKCYALFKRNQEPARSNDEYSDFEGTENYSAYELYNDFDDEVPRDNDLRVPNYTLVAVLGNSIEPYYNFGNLTSALVVSKYIISEDLTDDEVLRKLYALYKDNILKVFIKC